MYELMVRRSFAAAHQLRGYKGKCEELHGHNWVVEAFVEAHELDSIGIAIDFTQLKAILAEVLEALDHKLLNDLPPFERENPSSENLARHVHGEVGRLLAGKPVRLARVRVWESADTCVTYTRGESR